MCEMCDSGTVLDELTKGVRSFTPDEVEVLAAKAVKMASEVGEPVSKPITELVMPLIATVNLLSKGTGMLAEAHFRFINTLLELDTETSSVAQVKEMALADGLGLALVVAGV